MIAGLGDMTGFMQSLDVFEKSKVLGKHFTFEWDFNLETHDPLHINWDPIPEIIAKQKEENSKGKLQIIFLGIVVLRDEESKKTWGINKAWWKPEIKSISNGESWTTLKSALECLDYKVEVDENLLITKVSNKLVDDSQIKK
ncbi:hypothetical protein MHBO_004330 [Bonamia ostreae]|uniref:Uncharacterized protein n=1 Tax=Bonamia ostreae TaxID=126728 RepID=A0ABV2ATV1_9EUKA